MRVILAPLWKFDFLVFIISADFCPLFVSILCLNLLCQDNYPADVHLVRVDRDPQLLGVKQYVIVARNGIRKMNILLRLLIRLRYGQCIIFVNDHKK